MYNNVVHTLLSAFAVCLSVNALVVTTSLCERQRVVVNCACSLQHEMQSIGASNSIFHLVVRSVAALEMNQRCRAGEYRSSQFLVISSHTFTTPSSNIDGH
jgi:hypothetical protein